MAIVTTNITPSIYSKESRDFQLLSRLFDSVFNYSKVLADSIENMPLSRNADERFLDLTARTLGFESKHEYNTNNLLALCNSFKKIVAQKGTKKSIEDAVSMLLSSQNIKELFIVDTTTEKYVVKIFIPKALTDVILLEDVMSYILPAGYVYEIYSRDLGQSEVEDRFTAMSSQVKIEGTSQQLSRLHSYIGSSLVTDITTQGDVDDAVSGKDYIDDKRGE